eukprot:6661733-Pyramimonas_sp.AAC.1
MCIRDRSGDVADEPRHHPTGQPVGHLRNIPPSQPRRPLVACTWLRVASEVVRWSRGCDRWVRER